MRRQDAGDYVITLDDGTELRFSQEPTDRELVEAIQRHEARANETPRDEGNAWVFEDGTFVPKERARPEWLAAVFGQTDQTPPRRGERFEYDSALRNQVAPDRDERRAQVARAFDAFPDVEVDLGAVGNATLADDPVAAAIMSDPDLSDEERSAALDWYADAQEASGAGPVLPIFETEDVPVALLGAAQGASANFGDELLDPFIAHTGFEGDDIFAGAFQSEPLSYSAGWFGGSAVGAPQKAFQAGGLLKFSKQPRLVQRAIQGVLGGSAAGALENAGAAKGGIFERGDDAVIGALIGGVLGPLMNIAGPIGGALRNKTPGMRGFGETARAYAMIGDAVEIDMRMWYTRKLVENGKTREQAAAAAAKLKPDQIWKLLSDEAIAINQRAGIVTAGGKGSIAKDVTMRADQEGRSPATLLDLAEEMGLANVTMLLRGAASKPGAGQSRVAMEAITRRNQRKPRMLDRLQQLRQNDGDRLSAKQVVDEIAKVRADTADGLYDALRDFPIDSDAFPAEVRRTLFEGDGTGVFQKKLRELWDLSNAGDISAEKAALIRQWVVKGNNGWFSIRDGAPASVWDLYKRRIDGLVWNNRRNTSGSAYPPDVMFDIKRKYWQMVDAIDSQTTVPSEQWGDVSVYKFARSAYAGDSAAMDAVAVGEDVLKKTGHRDFMIDVERMGDHEKLAAATAAYDTLVNRLAEGTDTAFAGVFDDTSRSWNPQLVERMRALFGDEVDDVLAGVVDEADRLKAINTIDPKSGSQTAPILRAERAVDEAAASGALDFASGTNLGTMTISLIRKTLRGEALSEAQADEVLRVALDPYTPKAVRDALMKALEQQRARMARPAKGRASAPAIGAVTPNGEDE